MAHTLLDIDSSPLGNRSISRHLTHEVVDSWKTRQSGRPGPDARPERHCHPTGGRAAWIAAAYTPEEEADRRAAQPKLALSESLIAELGSRRPTNTSLASRCIHFGVPSVLKLWIDQILQRRTRLTTSPTPPERRSVC